MAKKILMLVFVAFLLTRFWDIQHRIIFDWDQEQFSNQIYDIVKNGKFTLLGPRVTDDLGFFLAPYFTYLLIPFYLLTKLNPIALIPFLLCVNVAFFWGSYAVVTKLFGKNHALMFLALWTVSSYHIKYDAIPWWPVYLPLGVISTWYFLQRVARGSSMRDWVLLGITLGFFSNMHFQFALIALFVAIFIVIQAIQEKQYPFMRAGVLLVSFLAMFLPLLLFDLRHEFLNTNLMINYFAAAGTHIPKDRWVWTEVWANALQPYTYIRSVTGSLAALVGFIVTSIWLFRSSTEPFKKNFFASSAILLLLIPLVFAVYGKRPSEYYFLVFYPFLHLTLAHLLLRIPRYLYLIVIAVLVMGNVPAARYELLPNPQGLAAKEKIVDAIAQEVGSRPYTISFDGPPNTDTGFRYLLKIRNMPYGLEDPYPMIGVHIPEQPGDIVMPPYGITIPRSLQKP